MENECNYHYIHVKDFYKFRYNKAKYKDKNYSLAAKKILLVYRSVCKDGKDAIKKPEMDSSVQLTRHHKQLRAPYLTDADFVSNLKEFQEIIRNNPSKPYTGKH